MAYINRDDALFAALVGADNWDGGSNYERDVAIEKEINKIPTADVVEVRHGKWETIPDYSQALISYRHICSECKTFHKDIRPYGHDYCPNCGAKMDGDKL